MEILVLFASLGVLSLLALLGRSADSKNDTGRCDWAAPFSRTPASRCSSW